MSLKGDKYETSEEIKARLENSVVTYDGKPVYISDVTGVGAEDGNEIARVFYQALPWRRGAQKVRKYLSSRKFDLTPLKLGYVNNGQGKAIFVSRTPVRQYKQGLNEAVTRFTDVRGKPCHDIGFNQLIQSQYFLDMLNGKYPSFKEAGEMLGNAENSSVAISREFAFIIDHDLEVLGLMHKSVRCGLAMKGDKAIRIAPKFHFLREQLEEYRIPLA